MRDNHLHFEMRGAVAVIRLSRPTKRNALNDSLVLALRNRMDALPAEARPAQKCSPSP
jgi:(methylthio)acryloyl-CoA hydratase